MVNYLDQQLGRHPGRRRRADRGAGPVPTVPQPLSIGGLIKHVTYGMHGATERLTGSGAPPAESTSSAFTAYRPASP